MATEMAAGRRLLTPAEARRRCPQLMAPQLAAVLESTIELRVESRDAIPRLAAWLASRHSVAFMRNATVSAIEVPSVHTSRGTVQAERVAVCPGDDFTGLYAERIGSYALTRCKLQMLRLADPGFDLARRADVGPGPWPLPRLCRVAGCGSAQGAPGGGTGRSSQPRHSPHRGAEWRRQPGGGRQPSLCRNSRPVLATAGGCAYPRPICSALGIEPPPTIERWIGTYASASDRPLMIDEPEPSVRIAIVTCGAGASTGFAIGEELVTSLLDTGVSA